MATRYFHQRVKLFINKIVMARSNPLSVKYYSYKVEFQARGAAHIHGILWLNMFRLEKLILKNGFVFRATTSANHADFTQNDF